MIKETLYLCGPTVYNHVHIGNMRSLMYFDILNRVKLFNGIEVNYLHNITDIDDKIINKAIEENKTEKEISEFYYQEYIKLFSLYNINFPTKIIKVTEKIDWIINYIQELLDKKIAYKKNNNVFFDVTKNPKYGEISNRKLEDMKNEEVNEYDKKNIQDFALWKETNLGIKFETPFGKGRPGWHTECAAMIYYYFDKKTIDIHAGGIDLIFPHHENENAQHFSLTNSKITKKWIHSGFLNKDGTKMSKSIGNILLAKDFITKFHPDTFRQIILTTNITYPIDLTNDIIKTNEDKIKQLRKINFLLHTKQTNIEKEINQIKIKELIKLILDKKNSAFNKELNTLLKEKDYANLIEVHKILGFSFVNEKIEKEDLNMYYQWQKYRENKDFQKADELRQILVQKGLI
ncbi:cysteine--tRNA ligase [Mesomycoplasma molare]|uniref:Cysteine--tRNA ligase n=1 Tax=Mesomycoplasma molare TaxID=171288 RepID=A0ABY5TTS8_9BACT|nr:cysteine--tRNA ligase [Mesomycoplasma molare]UWD34072.1 cysteine--tRNA ligase [Mesomycoplasma molare]